MTDDKKAAARKAAAKHSNNIVLATIEFGRLTDRLDQLSNDFSCLREEMLAQLPTYRHPAKDNFCEYMVFFDPNFLSIDAKMYAQPAFLESMTGDQLEAAKQYVRESELKKIEAADSNGKLAEMMDKFSRAKKAHEECLNKRPDKRNTLVAQAIGLSSGVPPKRLDKKKIWFDYVLAIRKEGLSRQAALEKTRKAHDITSTDRTRATLFDYRRTLLEKWTRDSPSMVPEIKKRLVGLIPSKTR